MLDKLVCAWNGHPCHVFFFRENYPNIGEQSYLLSYCSLFQENWNASFSVNAHHGGAYTLQWLSIHERRFLCSGGADRCIKIWMLTESSDSKAVSLSMLTTLDGHSDTVRSVAWMPLPGGDDLNPLDDVDMVVVARLASSSQVVQRRFSV